MADIVEEAIDTHSSVSTVGSELVGTRKRRVGKACDSCRIKKTKCDGIKPCSRCIADNKICIYSDSRRAKEKSYPAGYVELLETRVDLLSRSMEKLVELIYSNKDLEFLKSKTDGKYSVNEVITLLVDNQGLLNKYPVVWDEGMKLASQLPADQEGIAKVSSEFAKHSRETSKNEKENTREMRGLKSKKRGRKGKKIQPSLPEVTVKLETPEDGDSKRSSEASVNSVDDLRVDLFPFSPETSSLNVLANITSLRFSDFESDNSYQSEHEKSPTENWPAIPYLSEQSQIPSLQQAPPLNFPHKLSESNGPQLRRSSSLSRPSLATSSVHKPNNNSRRGSFRVLSPKASTQIFQFGNLESADDTFFENFDVISPKSINSIDLGLNAMFLNEQVETSINENLPDLHVSGYY